MCDNTSKGPAVLHATCQSQAHQQTTLEIDQSLLTFTWGNWGTKQLGIISSRSTQITAVCLGSCVYHMRPPVANRHFLDCGCVALSKIKSEDTSLLRGCPWKFTVLSQSPERPKPQKDPGSSRGFQSPGGISKKLNSLCTVSPKPLLKGSVFPAQKHTVKLK